MSNILSCCFSGYRPYKFGFDFSENDLEYKKMQNKLIDAVFSMPNKNCYKFYCGMAMGFDILAAETVLMLKEIDKTVPIELIGVIPFKEQAKSWDDIWKKRYADIYGKADKIICASPEYRRGCYQKRNHYMVDNSDILITWYDGKSGGTADTIGYAMRKGREIINLTDYEIIEDEINSTYIVVEDEI